MGTSDDPTKKIYVQIGAGAGDQDSRALYRDGFSEFVKRLPNSEVGQIVLAEPNPSNIAGLRNCWKDYPQAEICQVGIVTKRESGQVLDFYIALEDAPHYQVASINPAHVLKHYPNLKIEDLVIDKITTQDLETFISDHVGGRRIELLGLDVEGIDAEVLLDTDIASLNARLISFEHLHLGDKANEVFAHLERAGYEKAGIGVDHNGYDWLYRKVSS